MPFLSPNQQCQSTEGKTSRPVIGREILPDGCNESFDGFRDAVRVRRISLVDRRIFRVDGQLFGSKDHVAGAVDQFFAGAGYRPLGAPSLITDLGRHARKLRWWSKRGQDVNGLQERSGCLGALPAVFVGKLAVQYLPKESHSHYIIESSFTSSFLESRMRFKVFDHKSSKTKCLTYDCTMVGSNLSSVPSLWGRLISRLCKWVREEIARCGKGLTHASAGSGPCNADKHNLHHRSMSAVMLTGNHFTFYLDTPFSTLTMLLGRQAGHLVHRKFFYNDPHNSTNVNSALNPSTIG